MKADKPQITLIGCGNLGSALLGRWLDSNLEASFTVIKPTSLPENLTAANHFTTMQGGAEALKTSNLIILAVKPQIISDICTDLKPYITPQTPILSIAAGKTFQTLEQHLHPNQPIIRAMPNTPVTIGKGATVCISNTKVPEETKNLTTVLFEKTGLTEWIDDETLIDAITALSASGPAYLYYFTEALAKAASNNGLPEDLANKLAQQTIIGAANLIDQSDKNITTLRENVTSKAGVTEAALKVLMDGKLEEILTKTLAANINRSKELGN